jgi:hypothetical protein
MLHGMCFSQPIQTMTQMSNSDSAICTSFFKLTALTSGTYTINNLRKSSTSHIISNNLFCPNEFPSRCQDSIFCFYNQEITRFGTGTKVNQKKKN